MSLEHSPARQRKGPASAAGGLERLWTREEIAARYADMGDSKLGQARPASNAGRQAPTDSREPT